MTTLLYDPDAPKSAEEIELEAIIEAALPTGVSAPTWTAPNTR